MGFTVFSQARSILSFANFSYLISCSKLSNTSALKNSPSVISKPSHSFFDRVDAQFLSFIIQHMIQILIYRGDNKELYSKNSNEQSAYSSHILLLELFAHIG